jgi:crossover junction endodeoxyribonuclease RuvC
VKTIGIDPGLSGAMALYDSETGELTIVDMPVATVEKKGRKRGQRQLDMVPLQQQLAVWTLAEGAELALIEQVSSRPTDGAMHAFAFGRTYGQIEASLVSSGARIERVSPVKWKKAMKCPVEAAAIAQRADEVFPEYRTLWRGPRGGVLHDRAEAALLAKYATMEFGR